MARYSAIHLGLLILALPTCIMHASPVGEQVEQQRQNNVRKFIKTYFTQIPYFLIISLKNQVALRADLTSKDSQLEALQQKNVSVF